MPVTIQQRFHGPPGSGNGGYTCGLLGELIGDSAVVTLRKPPPLDVPLEIVEDNRQWSLLHGDEVVATGQAGDLELDVPPPPSLEAAEQAQERYVGFAEHLFPTCFVCGPERAPGDGLRVFPGRVDDRTVAACVWTPDEAFGDDAGNTQGRIVWSALDCPTYFGGILGGHDSTAVLGRLATAIAAPVVAGRPHVVVSWPLAGDARKWRGGSAIFDEHGGLCAQAIGTWVVIDPERAAFTVAR